MSLLESKQNTIFFRAVHEAQILHSHQILHEKLDPRSPSVLAVMKSSLLSHTLWKARKIRCIVLRRNKICCPHPQVWHYREADPDLGAWQAKELLDHLEGVLANEPVEVISGQSIVEVKPQVRLSDIHAVECLTSFICDCLTKQCQQAHGCPASPLWRSKPRCGPRTSITSRLGRVSDAL